MSSFYPDLISQNLPTADIPLEGVLGKLLQGPGHQVVFFEIEPVGQIPPHSHGAQWGVVLEGELDLTIAGETRTFVQGDTYYIPAGVEHSAAFRTRFRGIDVFDEPDRYSARE